MGQGEAKVLNVLGAPKLTAHKPPLPLCNKVMVEVSPRIEKLIIEMHHEDYQLLYKPGKDEADSLKYLPKTLCVTQKMTRLGRLTDGT